MRASSRARAPRQRLLACAAILAAAAGRAPAQTPDRPPNVVLIFSDDQGMADLGDFGTADVITPSLDALAARGVRLSQMYAAAPVCSPSRAALLTGRVPQRCGVPGNVSPGGPGLPGSEVTLAEALQAHG